MMFEKEHKARVDKLFSNMTARAKPRLWKNGKNKGKVRIPGLTTLPFWPDELWSHVLAQVPDGGALCPYCKDYGRSTLIYLDTFVLDHHRPLKHDGLASWELHNLVCVCADCNNIKGSMSYTAFIVLMRDFLPDFDLIDRKYITSCLRTHGQVVRGFAPKPKAKELPAPTPFNPQRRLEEEF
jgi:5-methylcytosine-specific restriction endonuclease McrA